MIGDGASLCEGVPLEADFSLCTIDGDIFATAVPCDICTDLRVPELGGVAVRELLLRFVVRSTALNTDRWWAVCRAVSLKNLPPWRL